MIKKINLKKSISLGIFLMLALIAISTSCYATQQPPTNLDITVVKGGFGKVSITIKNIGNSTAENITMIISVKGGIFNRINITKICSGCGNCSNSIDPNETKTESTSEAGVIIGFGPIIITASAEATNAEPINKTFNGFVFGFLVIITK